MTSCAPGSQSQRGRRDQSVATTQLIDRMWREGRKMLEQVPAQLALRERLYLYASVFARAPARVLEIGVSQGFSSMIIAAALRDLATGGERSSSSPGETPERARLVGLDPEPQIPFDWDRVLGDTATLLIGASPADLGAARDSAGGLFDFVFIDGDHEYEGVAADLRGVIEVTHPGAIILCHDAYYAPARQAMDDALASGLPLTDVGMVCTTASPGTEHGQPVTYCGLRQFVRTA